MHFKKLLVPVAVLALTSAQAAWGGNGDGNPTVTVTVDVTSEAEPAVTVSAEFSTKLGDLGASTLTGMAGLSGTVNLSDALSDPSWDDLADKFNLRLGLRYTLGGTPLTVESYLFWKPRRNWDDSLRPEFGGNVGPYRFGGGSGGEDGITFLKVEFRFLAPALPPNPGDPFPPLAFDRIAYVMTPVPEPGSAWMFATGFALLGAWRVRRPERQPA